MRLTIESGGKTQSYSYDSIIHATTQYPTFYFHIGVPEALSFILISVYQILIGIKSISVPPCLRGHKNNLYRQ